MAAPSETVIVSWSFTNWITILLMVAVGFSALGLVTHFIKKMRSNDNAAS